MADGEAEVGVGDGGVVGADLDLGGLRVDGDGDAIALEIGLDGEVGEELDGEDPGFELAVLGTDEDAAGASYGEGLDGLGGAVDD